MTEELAVQEPQLVAITVIGVKDRSTLVQTADFKRYYVPTNKVKDGTIPQDTLDKAVGYGIQWEAYLVGLDPQTTESLARMLRQAGIYTAADLAHNDRQLIRIGTSIIGEAVREAARKAETGKPPRRNNAQQ